MPRGSHTPLLAAVLLTWRVTVISLLAAVLLTGCNTGGDFGYEFSYPSGYIRNSYTWDESVPVEGTEYQLRCPKADDYNDTHEYDLQVFDNMEELIFQYQELGSVTVRGEVGEEIGTIWVCSEAWNAPHYNGYRNGCLKGSTLLLIDMADGEILFQVETGENELYLTSVGERCYFYFPGKESEEKLFGLIRTRTRQAEIFYREMSDWSEKNTVYTFEFAGSPRLENGELPEKMIFYPRTNYIHIELAAREERDGECMERKSYHVQIYEK